MALAAGEKYWAGSVAADTDGRLILIPKGAKLGPLSALETYWPGNHPTDEYGRLIAVGPGGRDLGSTGVVKALGEVSGLVKVDLTEGRIFTATLKGATEFEVANAPEGVAQEITLLVEQNGAGGFNWGVKNAVWVGTEPTFEKTAHRRYAVNLLCLNGEVIAVASQGPQGKQGEPGEPFYPWSVDSLLGWTFDPVSSASEGTQLSSGVIRASKVMVAPGSTLQYLLAEVKTAGSGLEANKCWGAVVSPAGITLGRTANQATAWAEALTEENRVKKMALTAAEGQSLKVAEGVRWVYGVLLSNGTANPKFASQASPSTKQLVNANLAAGTFRSATYNTTSQTTIPSSLEEGNWTSQSAELWMGLA